MRLGTAWNRRSFLGTLGVIAGSMMASKINGTSPADLGPKVPPAKKEPAMPTAPDPTNPIDSYTGRPIGGANNWGNEPPEYEQPYQQP